MIDSDDDLPATTVQEQTLPEVTFDSEHEPVDIDEQPVPVVAETHILLETGVRKLASCPLPPDTVFQPLRDSIPSLFREKIVLAVACEDGTTRVLSLPLKPLGPLITVEKTRPLPGRLFTQAITDPPFPYHGLPQAVAVTYTINACSETHRQSQKQTHNTRQSQKNEKQSLWDIVVASHFGTACQTLLTFRVLISDNAKNPHILDHSDEATIQQSCLPSPVSCLSFSPARYPSFKHLQLLLADAAGAVRICEAPPRLDPDIQDDFTSSEPTWIATFLVRFAKQHSQHGQGLPASRARILDAQWALNGKCIVVLLSDGQWGLWDLEDAGPSPQGTQGSSTQLRTGVTGAGVTQFSLQGFTGSSESQLNTRSSLGMDTSSSTRSLTKGSRGSLAPMTPRTRKTRQESLFSSTPQRSGASTIPSLLTQGGISITPTSQTDRKSPDSSIIFWYRNEAFSIPSLMSHWQRAVNATVRNQSASFIPTGSVIHRLDELNMHGERITGIAQVPQDPNSSQKTVSTAKALHHDIVVASEHRLLLLCPRRMLKSEYPNSVHNLRDLFPSLHPREEDDEDGRTLEPFRPFRPLSEERVDQSLLEQGDLDLGGVERMLDGMEKRKAAPLSPSRTQKHGRPPSRRASSSCGGEDNGTMGSDYMMSGALPATSAALTGRDVSGTGSGRTRKSPRKVGFTAAS